MVRWISQTATVQEVIEHFRWFKNQRIAVAIWCEDDVLELAREEGIKCSRKRAREIIDENKPQT